MKTRRKKKKNVKHEKGQAVELTNAPFSYFRTNANDFCHTVQGNYFNKKKRKKVLFVNIQIF